MTKILISGDSLSHDGKTLGPATAFYTSPGEARHLGEVSSAVQGRSPHNIDILFAVPDKVVGCEVKTVQDLIGSWRSRRLQRQLRTLRAVTDLPVLIIRKTDSISVNWEVELRLNDKEYPQFWEDWVHLQTNGVYILPVRFRGYGKAVQALRGALSKNSARILAGTDQRPPRERRAGWLLRRIPGIGSVHSKALMDNYGSPFAALQAAIRGRVATKFGKSLEEKLCKAATE